MDELSLLRIWAKTDDQNPSSYHPLLFHMLDVANVARLIWSDCVAPAAKRRLSESLHLTELELTGMVAWLAGMHDLGKASPAFQSLRKDLAAVVEEAGLPLGAYQGNRPHGEISARDVRRLLLEDGHVGRAGVGLATGLAALAGGHHGTFPRAYDLQRLGSDNLGDERWSVARSRLGGELWRLLNIEKTDQISLSAGALDEASHVPIIAGLISVADWIGSDADFFPPCAVTSTDDYAELSRRQADNALRARGWLPALTAAASQTFTQIFSFAPNALQEVVAAIAEQQDGPYIAIIEAQMGSGKTEAALHATDVALCSGRAQGFYIALPTQATSNAMYARVKEDYLVPRGHRGNTNAQLVHGNALLIDVAKISAVGNEQSDGDASVAARSWFTARKRSLLAPFGIGTIDQSLMSVIQTRHWFVRLFGLANKVIVFDEVHAYDTYMSTILERLVQWLSAVNCTVLLLSATLPLRKLESLLDAYLGKDVQLPAVAAYPRVTAAARLKSPESVPVAVESEKKTFRLEFARPDLQSIADLITTRLTDGGCAAIIANTVDRAQSVYSRLAGSCDDCDLILFHARMPFGWRKQREEEILARFGKPDRNGQSPQRPRKAIVVATQVIEQSLDLDFDWIISDMAPIDLLLQRMGREHRHERSCRPLRDPVFTVLADETPTGSPPLFPHSKVYEHYVLLRSWLALRLIQQIAVPDDIDGLVQQVYSDILPDDLDEQWLSAIRESLSDMSTKRENDRAKAGSILIPEPGMPEDILGQFNLELADDDDPSCHPSIKAATRDGDPSVQVVCLAREGERIITAFNGIDVDLTAAPNQRQLEAILLSSVPVSSRHLFHMLVSQPVPAGWRKSPHLRYHRAVEFTNGRARIGSHTVELCPVRGLLIHSKEDG